MVEIKVGIKVERKKGRPLESGYPSTPLRAHHYKCNFTTWNTFISMHGCKVEFIRNEDR